MNKAEIITRLRDSKKAHMTWVTHAHALVEGLSVAEEKVPVHGTECGFGCWYYGEGQILSQLAAFRKVEDPHLKLHDVYMEIHKLLRVADKEDTSGLFGRMLGSAKKLAEEKAAAQAQAHQLFAELKQISRDIASHLDDLQQQLIEMDDAKLDAMLSAQGVAMPVHQSIVSFRQYPKTV